MPKPVYVTVTPVKDASRMLPEFLASLVRLEPAPARMFFLLNDSSDDSAAQLEKFSRGRGGVTVAEASYPDPDADKRKDRGAYMRRLCKVRNAAVSLILNHKTKWTHALLYDATKLAHSATPGKLLELKADLAAPIVTRPGICAFADLDNFKDQYGVRFKAEPPFFVGPIVSEVSSVGGVVMADRRVFAAAGFSAPFDEEDGSFVNFCDAVKLRGHSCMVRRDVCAVTSVFSGAA